MADNYGGTWEFVDRVHKEDSTSYRKFAKVGSINIPNFQSGVTTYLDKLMYVPYVLTI